MRSLIIPEAGKTTLITAAAPSPKEDEVLLKVNYIGICGSDLNSYLGKNPLVNYPVVPGHEIAATIVDAGAAVPEAFRKGITVTANPYTSCGRCASCLRGRINACRYNQTLGVQRNGAMSDFITLPWQKLFFDEALSLKQLALVEPLSVGFHAVSRGRVQPEDTVMVIGCGMIGLGAIAGASRRGARVIAVDLEDRRLQQAGELGAAYTVNTTQTNLHGQLQEVTEGLGPDVVIEAVGSPQTYLTAVEEVAFTGRVVYIGYAKTDICFQTQKFVQKEIDILGSRNALTEDFVEVIQYLKSGACSADAIISGIIAPDQISSAFEQWQQNTKTLVAF